MRSTPGATRIDVAIEEGGRRLIRVIDDGCGMDEHDLTLAVERHATSKIPDGDLTNIATLGFRGEALPSIAAVADLTIDTRAQDAPHGFSIRVEAGEKRGLSASNWPRGTKIEARALFAATPARLKFLKTERTEAAAVVDVVKRLAMAHPDVRFTFSADSGALFDYPACGGRRARGASRKCSATNFAPTPSQIDARARRRSPHGLRRPADLQSRQCANAICLCQRPAGARQAFRWRHSRRLSRFSLA